MTTPSTQTTTGGAPTAPSPVVFGVGDPAAGQGASPPITCWTTDDIHGRVEALVAAGATLRRPVSDVDGGLLVAVLADATGNLIGLRGA